MKKYNTAKLQLMDLLLQTFYLNEDTSNHNDKIEHQKYKMILNVDGKLLSGTFFNKFLPQSNTPIFNVLNSSEVQRGIIEENSLFKNKIHELHKRLNTGFKELRVLNNYPSLLLAYIGNFVDEIEDADISTITTPVLYDVELIESKTKLPFYILNEDKECEVVSLTPIQRLQN